MEDTAETTWASVRLLAMIWNRPNSQLDLVAVCDATQYMQPWRGITSGNNTL
jgi:hypothetical protein